MGRERTLKALAAEAAANEARYKARVRTALRSSYSAHWRRMLSPLLGVLELKCNNTAYRPVMDAIDLLQRYPDQPLKEGAFFDPAEGAGAVLRGGQPDVLPDQRGQTAPLGQPHHRLQPAVHDQVRIIERG
ncbi:hypothetical protein ACFC09_17365 [Streptomyces sp. NPDC056161]|uniref:hypothetical protein n=1 Tax=Streptomyces sp. NPDC056161 TaxID=3345732 RepID=UPI0035D74E5C